MIRHTILSLLLLLLYEILRHLILTCPPRNLSIFISTLLQSNSVPFLLLLSVLFLCIISLFTTLMHPRIAPDYCCMIVKFLSTLFVSSASWAIQTVRSSSSCPNQKYSKT